MKFLLLGLILATHSTVFAQDFSCLPDQLGSVDISEFPAIRSCISEEKKVIRALKKEDRQSVADRVENARLDLKLQLLRLEAAYLDLEKLERSER